jgi:hypothetical protein
MFQFFQEELIPETYPSFEDVKQIFDDASPGLSSATFWPSPLYQSSLVDIDPEQMLRMKDFALHDAMMAVEVWHAVPRSSSERGLNHLSIHR